MAGSVYIHRAVCGCSLLPKLAASWWCPEHSFIPYIPQLTYLQTPTHVQTPISFLILRIGSCWNFYSQEVMLNSRYVLNAALYVMHDPILLVVVDKHYFRRL